LRNFQSPRRRVFESATGASFAEAFGRAERMRKAGKPVVITGIPG
jgi:hypothetical protein